MAINPNPDRDREYMYQTWGTDKLVTDYTVLPADYTVLPENYKKQVIQEIMHDEIPFKKHNLTEQARMHEQIRNDEDYDDWEYGTEPTYGSSVN
jgi:hypothetical protein